MNLTDPYLWALMGILVVFFGIIAVSGYRRGVQSGYRKLFMALSEDLGDRIYAIRFRHTELPQSELPVLEQTRKDWSKLNELRHYRAAATDWKTHYKDLVSMLHRVRRLEKRLSKLL